MLAYQTAYLKANYPVEYNVLPSSVVNRGKNDKVAACMDECGADELPVLPPDVTGLMWIMRRIRGGRRGEVNGLAGDKWSRWLGAGEQFGLGCGDQECGGRRR